MLIWPTEYFVVLFLSSFKAHFNAIILFKCCESILFCLPASLVFSLKENIYPLFVY